MINSITVSKSLIRDVLQKYHLGSLNSCREIKVGLFNRIFVINNLYVLRINSKQTPNSRKNIEKEVFLYQLLSKYNIPTPKVIAIDKTRKIVKGDYFLASFIPGKSLGSTFTRYNEKQKDSLAFQLGRIAKKIHSIKKNELSIFLKGKTDWKTTIIKEFCSYFRPTKDKQIFSDEIIDKIWLAYNQFTNLDNLSNKFRLIHGDFSRNNFQVNNGKIVGVFDFEMATLGDPLYDLQKLPINFQLGNSFNKNIFLQGYGQINFSQEEKLRLKFYSLLQGLWEMWAAETGQFLFGDKEINEGERIIINSLEYYKNC